MNLKPSAIPPALGLTGIFHRFINLIEVSATAVVNFDQYDLRHSPQQTSICANFSILLKEGHTWYHWNDCNTSFMKRAMYPSRIVKPVVTTFTPSSNASQVNSSHPHAVWCDAYDIHLKRAGQSKTVFINICFNNFFRALPPPRILNHLPLQHSTS